MMSPLKVMLRCAGNFHIARNISNFPSTVEYDGLQAQVVRSDFGPPHARPEPAANDSVCPGGGLTLETAGETNGGGRYEIERSTPAHPELRPPPLSEKESPF